MYNDFMDMLNSISDLKVKINYYDGEIDNRYFDNKLTEEQLKTANEKIRIFDTTVTVGDFFDGIDIEYYLPNAKFIWHKNGEIDRKTVCYAISVLQDGDMLGLSEVSNYLDSEGIDMEYYQEFMRECGVQYALSDDSYDLIIDKIEEQAKLKGII